MANIPIDKDNVHTLKVGSYIGFPAPDSEEYRGKRCLITRIAGNEFIGKWDVPWDTSCRFSPLFLEMHKYWIITKKPTIIIG